MLIAKIHHWKKIDKIIFSLQKMEGFFLKKKQQQIALYKCLHEDNVKCHMLSDLRGLDDKCCLE